MRLYSVHVPPDHAWTGAPAEPERYAFVKDGFSWPALLVAPLWMLWHRLWLALVYGIAFALALAWVSMLAGGTAAALIAALGVLLLALEGNSIRRLSLASRGWSEVGGSSGRNLEEAETLFFAREAERHERDARDADELDHARRVREEDEPVLGLFPDSERG